MKPYWREDMNVSEMLRTKVEASLETSIVNMIDRDYSMISGDKVREMFAKDLVELVREEFKEIDSVEVGQMLWMGVHKDDRPSYGKNSRNTHMIPITLTLISNEDLDMRLNGYTNREVRERRIVRMFNEAYNQDALLSNGDVASLIGVSPTTVGKHAREFMERENVIVPTRGTIHDLGMATTHKKVIIRLYLDGHITPEISRITNHSEEAIDRYIRSFEKVRLLRGKDVDYIHRATGMGKWLVKKYLEILDEFDPRGDET
jgi:hypothetical protein